MLDRTAPPQLRMSLARRHQCTGARIASRSAVKQGPEIQTHALHRASSNPGPDSASLSEYALSPAVLSRAANRLPWIAVAVSLCLLLLFVIEGFFDLRMADAERSGWLLASIGVLAVFPIVLLVMHRAGCSAKRLLDVGLGYEIIGAFALMTLEYGVPLTPDEPVRGVSKTAVWIYVFTLSIPSTAVRSCTAAMLAACMGLLAVWFSAYRAHEPITLPLTLVHLLLDFVVAALAFVLSRRTNALRGAAVRAREMGSYQLESLIGEGGMGQVWRSRHRLLIRDAAVKVIRPELLAQRSPNEAAAILRRFEKEARTTAILKSAHTVQLYDFGVTDDGTFYYAMELLSGTDLEQLIIRFGPQSPSRVKTILLQVCESLEEAHALGMVHRDIKPRNIFLCQLGSAFDFVKVLDFGLVRHLDTNGSSLLNRNRLASGTPAFMSPEAVLGQGLDSRADIYGVGCVAYWLLTGELVFEVEGTLSAALAHVQRLPSPPSERSRFQIPPALERVIMRCLEKDPSKRPQSAGELRNILERECDCGVWSRTDAANWWRMHDTSSVTVEVDEQRSTATLR